MGGLLGHKCLPTSSPARPCYITGALFSLDKARWLTLYRPFQWISLWLAPCLQHWQDPTSHRWFHSFFNDTRTKKQQYFCICKSKTGDAIPFLDYRWRLQVQVRNSHRCLSMDRNTRTTFSWAFAGSAPWGWIALDSGTLKTLDKTVLHTALWRGHSEWSSSRVKILHTSQCF